MADGDVSTALLEKRKAMRVFLSKHGMETVAKEFHDAGYIETGDVMDMDAEDVDELHFLNAAQKELLLKLLDPQHDAGPKAAAIAELEHLRRENQQLQEQLYDVKGAAGAKLHVVQQDKRGLEVALQKATAESATLRTQVAAEAAKVKAAEKKAAEAKATVLKAAVEELAVATQAAAEDARLKAIVHANAEDNCVETDAEPQMHEMRLAHYRSVARTRG
jgi:hypothetical protein